MDKIIVTAFLVVAGAVSSIFLFNSVYPAIGQSSDALSSMEARIDERIKSQVEIILAVKSGGDVLVWAKNVGELRVNAPEAADLFFGPDTSYARIPYGSGTPHWEYSVENDSAWNPGATLRIRIADYPALPSGQYYVKLVTSNGAAADYTFSW